MNRACKDCEFYKADGSTDWSHATGSCHRHPPVFCVEPGAALTVVWPPVHEDDWCGEFRLREVEAPAPLCVSCARPGGCSLNTLMRCHSYVAKSQEAPLDLCQSCERAPCDARKLWPGASVERCNGYVRKEQEQ